MSMGEKIKARVRASDSRASTDLAPLDGGANARQQRLQQFEQFCKRWGVSERACQGWIASSDYPFCCFLLCFWAAAISIVLRSLIYIVGSWKLPHALRIRYTAAAAAANMTSVIASTETWRFGPLAATHAPWTIGPALLVHVALLYFLRTPPLFAPERRMPFQNRLLFLVGISAEVATDVVLTNTTLMSMQRGPPSTPVWKILSQVGIQTMRWADVFSDMIYIRVLWEKVRSCSCFVCFAFVWLRSWSCALLRSF